MRSFGLAQDLNISDYFNWVSSGATANDTGVLFTLPEATPGTSPFSLSMIAGLVDSGGNPITPTVPGSAGGSSAALSASGTMNSGLTVPISSTTWLLIGAAILFAIALMSSQPARYGG